MTSRTPVEFTDQAQNYKRVGNQVRIADIGNNIVTSIPVKFGDSASVNAFGRLSVSEPIGRFDAQLTYDLQPLLFEQITNGIGATITHDTTNRLAIMSLSNSPTGSYAYMQSYKWSYYHPGNAQRASATFNFKSHTPNVTKFVGYGDRQNNAIHFISNGTDFAWRILSNTGVGDQTILQTNWNLDKLNGNGLSRLNLYVSKIQIPVIDLQALYSGRVRVGFDIGGQTIYCHEFNHSNIAANPYIQIATLPIVAGLECTDTVTAQMNLICSTVHSEGAMLQEEGFEHSAEGTGTAANGVRTHILSVRPKTTFNSIENRTNIVLESIDVLVTGNNPVLWELVFGQAISGTTTFNDVNTTYSAMEFNTAGTISGSPTVVAKKGYGSSGAGNQSISFPTALSNRYPITLNAAGAIRSLGTVSIIATGLGASSAMRAVLNWREIR